MLTAVLHPYMQVCITLYWLGQTIAEMDDYSGPQLDLDAFKRIMYGNSTMNVSDFMRKYSTKETLKCPFFIEH